jgi:hypothetical protein
MSRSLKSAFRADVVSTVAMGAMGAMGICMHPRNVRGRMLAWGLGANCAIVWRVNISAQYLFGYMMSKVSTHVPFRVHCKWVWLGSSFATLGDLLRWINGNRLFVFIPTPPSPFFRVSIPLSYTPREPGQPYQDSSRATTGEDPQEVESLLLGFLVLTPKLQQKPK